MPEEIKPVRLGKFTSEFNVGITTIVEFLAKKGHRIDSNPNTKLSPELYQLLAHEFQSQKKVKDEAKKIESPGQDRHTISIEDTYNKTKAKEPEDTTEDILIKDSSFVDNSMSKEELISVMEKVHVSDKPKEKVRVEKAKEVTDEKPKEEKPKEGKPKEEKPGEEKPAVEVKEVKKEAPDLLAKEEEKVPAQAVEGASIREEVHMQQPVVLGTLDLDEINAKKPKKKTSEEKKKERDLKKKKTGKEAEPQPEPDTKTAEPEIPEVKVETPLPVPEEKPAVVPPKPEVPPPGEHPENFHRVKTPKLTGPKVLGTMILKEEKKPEKKPVASSRNDSSVTQRPGKRKRINKVTEKPPEHQKKTGEIKFEKQRPGFRDKKVRKEITKPEITQEDINKQIKETMAKMGPIGKSKSSKIRREKRHIISQQKFQEEQMIDEEKRILKVTEFVTANELATMMNVPVTNVIATCMDLGMFVSINQRLDAETLAIVADEFGYKVSFVSAEVQEVIQNIEEEEDDPKDLMPRAPIVTVMGHVDHGKTKLLDHIRKTNVIAGEAGGITQHIGAYEVRLNNDRKITFLDTPGHEAFTAMRARGAKITDVAIIVIAADDSVMPQTLEAINHAQAANVPIVFAFNKIDKPTANVEKIREQLANINILVEEWGGRYQTQEISAKEGRNIEPLLEKVLIEADMLELKANPGRDATGTVIESSLDKGRGYVAKLLVQNGTLHIGDVVIAGAHYGRVRAMFNERDLPIKEAGPSTPVLMLGFTSAPQAGDKFNVMKDEKEAKAITSKRQQLQREQGFRTKKHITLDEIGRRIAIGDFKELNVIVKGDVDGSVEALSDAILRLSNEQAQVNVIHKSVGQVTESDVNLALASDAIIVCFQVRPSVTAKKLAEQEQIDIRMYSVIYQAIEEIKSAIEGMLAPEIKEKIICNLEVKEVFKITKVGSVAGCQVLDGVITRNTKVRVIRDGIVVHSGNLGSLKRFKDDVKEVKAGYECGLNIDGYNDIQEGDIIEGYEQIEVKRKL